MIPIIFWIFLLSTCECVKICKKLDQYCYCDEKCSKYGDCCPKHRDFNKKGIWNNIFTCKIASGMRKAWIGDRCSVNDEILVDLCQKTKFIPGNRLKSFIYVKTDEGEIYENEFCAKCNNKTQFRYFNIKVKCSKNIPKTIKEANKMITEDDSCYVKTVFPETFLRSCHRKLVRTCPKDYGTNYNKTILDLCENKAWNYVREVSDGINFYRNNDCCSCWNKTCFDSLMLDLPAVSGFSYLLNFNEWEKEEMITNPMSNFTVNNGTSISKVENVIYYFSYIFTILSILSLLVLIVIYASKRTFHTFGGYLTICLSCCLLLMNFMTLLLTNKTVSSSLICKFLGIFQHYIALSNFIWMAIYALDLLQTFGFGTKSNSKKKSLKTFFIYCLFGFGLAAMIVGAATISEFNLNINSTVRPKYGGENCWFNSKLGGIVWYFLPVCLLLTWNFVSCVVVFYKLSKTAKECRVVQQKESNDTLWLCIRLTAVFGIGYCIQIIAILSGVQWLIVFGTLLNSLQGCLLSACFIWTKRVHSVITTTFATITGSTVNNSSSQSQTTRATTVSKDRENIKT